MYRFRLVKIFWILADFFIGIINFCYRQSFRSSKITTLCSILCHCLSFDNRSDCRNHMRNSLCRDAPYIIPYWFPSYKETQNLYPNIRWCKPHAITLWITLFKCSSAGTGSSRSRAIKWRTVTYGTPGFIVI